MIKEALAFLKGTLDQHFKRFFKLAENEDPIVLNYLIDQEGTEPLRNKNKVVISLINLEHETATQFYGGQQRINNNEIQKTNRAVRFNMDLLFTANFDDYEESLKFLDATVSYFQANNSLNRMSNPDIPNGLDKLNFDIENMTYFETHNLWSAMGAKYRPSVIYKVRHITIQSDQITEIDRSVQDALATVRP